MARHRVPVHLNAPDAIGRFTIRQIAIAAVGFKVLTEWVPKIPPLGPSIGDLIRMRYTHLVPVEGALPLLPVVVTAAVVAPLVAAAWPNDPPPEHGLQVAAKYLRRHGLVSRERVGDIIGNPIIDGDIAVSDLGYHAVWELPPRNLRLAGNEAVEQAEELWGQFLDGLTVPIQTLVIANRIDTNALVERFERYPSPRAKKLASWLRAQVATRHLIDRRYYVAFYQSDRSAFEEALVEITEGLVGLGIQQEQLRRLADDELRMTIRRTWSPRQLRKGHDCLPGGPWTIEKQQLASDLEWHEVVALGKWGRIARDLAQAWAVDGPYATDVVQFIEPLDYDKIKPGLERRLDSMKVTGLDLTRRMKLRDLEAFVEALEGGEENPFEVTTLFHVHGPDRAAVAKEAKRLKSRTQRTGASPATLPGEQADALVACAPLGVCELKHRGRRVDTSSVRNTIPFIASSMWAPGSVPLGEALTSPRLIGWTPWARPWVPTPGTFVAADSGTGKGYAVKCALSRLLFAREIDEIFGFDQAEEDLALGEYGRFAEYCGLEYVHVKTASDIDAALAGLKTPGRMWNIAQLAGPARAEMFVRAKDMLFARAARKRRRTHLVVDELYSFVKPHPSTPTDWAARLAAAIDDIARRGRHVWFGGVWMTQRIRDSMAGDPHVRALVEVIQSQAGSQLYGVQKPQEISAIQNDLKWTSAEVEAVGRFVPGQFLLTAGPWRVTLRITSSDEEFEMANTDGRVDRAVTEPAISGELRDSASDTDWDDTDHRNGAVAGGAVPPLEQVA